MQLARSQLCRRRIIIPPQISPCRNEAINNNSLCHNFAIVFFATTSNVRRQRVWVLGWRHVKATRHISYLRVIRENSIVLVEQLHFSGTQALLQLLRNHRSRFPTQLGDAARSYHTQARARKMCKRYVSVLKTQQTLHIAPLIGSTVI